MVDISIVILNYKSKGFTLNCIKSIKEADFKDLKYEIIVVDNNSDDSIGQILAWQYPEISFVANKVNVGMGAGNNVGIKRANGKYVVIMNPDTIAFSDTFFKLYEFMEENQEVALCGPQQLHPDKTIQNSCYHWPSLFTPMYRRTFLGNFRLAQKDLNRYLMKDFDHKSIKEVDWLLGSFLFCRKEMLEKIGLFDERYFMYFEDTDLCRRFWMEKKSVIYCPNVKIIHNHLRQSAQIEWYKFFINKAARNHIISWFKYLKKWGLTQKIKD